MKNTRKILSVVLSAVMMLSSVSCGGFLRPVNGPAEGSVQESRPTESNTPESSETTTPPETSVTTEDPGPAFEPARVSFVGCGDNIIYYGNVREAATKAPAGRQYGFAYSYDRVADIIKGADISFINQETLMCGEGYEPSYYPYFNSPQDLGYDLVDVGFDVINIANNHMVDKGGTGLGKTIDFWNEQSVLMIGGYKSEEDYMTPRFLESGGLRIAFLSYTYGSNWNWVGENDNVWVPYLFTNPQDDVDTVGIIDEAAIRRQTAAAKAEADIVIVSVHWGSEGAFAPSAVQKKCAKLFADLGVDVILGHHPHVIQPVEWIEGANGGKTLCVYSLGNFMAEMEFDYNMVGGMISFDMVRAETGETSIENVLFTPTVFHHDSAFYNNQVWRMEDYTPDMAASHGISYYGHYTSYDKLKKYVTDTIAPEFLPAFIKEN